MRLYEYSITWGSPGLRHSIAESLGYLTGLTFDPQAGESDTWWLRFQEAVSTRNPVMEINRCNFASARKMKRFLKPESGSEN